MSSDVAEAGPKPAQIVAATTHKPEALDTAKAHRPTAVFAFRCVTTDACACLGRALARQGSAVARADTYHGPVILGNVRPVAHRGCLVATNAASRPAFSAAISAPP